MSKLSPTKSLVGDRNGALKSLALQGSYKGFDLRCVQLPLTRAMSVEIGLVRSLQALNGAQFPLIRLPTSLPCEPNH